MLRRNALSFLLFELGSIEELNGLVGEKLGLALNGALVLEVGEGDEVFGVNGDSTTVWLRLVEALVHSSVVVVEQATVLHQFDSTGLNHTTSLRVLVHDGSLRLFRSVSDCDCLVNRVIICADLHLGFEGEVRASIFDALLHLETI